MTDATITRWLNTAQDRIARVQDWRELRQTTDVTIPFTSTPAADKIISMTSLLGSSFRKIQNIIIEDGAESTRLESFVSDQFDQMIPLPEYFATGRPTMYTLWKDDEVMLHKVPDQAYTARIRWHSWPVAMTSVSDNASLTFKDDVILHLTLSFAFSLFRMEESSLKHFGIYQTVLREAVDSDTRNPDLQVVRPNFIAMSNAARPEYWLDPFHRG